jgi:hypothetical protein
MSLTNVLLLSMAVVFIIIGINEMITLGVGNGYWAVMLSIVFFFLYLYRKKK